MRYALGVLIDAGLAEWDGYGSVQPVRKVHQEYAAERLRRFIGAPLTAVLVRTLGVPHGPPDGVRPVSAEPALLADIRSTYGPENAAALHETGMRLAHLLHAALTPQHARGYAAAWDFCVWVAPPAHSEVVRVLDHVSAARQRHGHDDLERFAAHHAAYAAAGHSENHSLWHLDPAGARSTYEFANYRVRSLAYAHMYLYRTEREPVPYAAAALAYTVLGDAKWIPTGRQLDCMVFAALLALGVALNAA